MPAESKVNICVGYRCRCKWEWHTSTPPASAVAELPSTAAYRRAWHDYIELLLITAHLQQDLSSNNTPFELRQAIMRGKLDSVNKMTCCVCTRTRLSPLCRLCIIFNIPGEATWAEPDFPLIKYFFNCNLWVWMNIQQSKCIDNLQLYANVQLYTLVMLSKYTIFIVTGYTV